jgi:hypothetical protein
MSLGAIPELSGASLAPLNPPFTAAAKTQAPADRAAADRATAQSPTGAVATKPPPPVMAVPVQPLSPAVLAELVGLQLPF